MKTITVFLGARCNAHCAYCHADKRREGSSDPSPLFSRYLKETGKPGDGLTIWFLGGEPTLYMNTIRTIVDLCSGREVSYMVTTNGLRLSEDEIVDYFNYHNFYVNVSYDGVRGIRGYDDVFYRPEYSFNLRRLKKLGCSMTLSRENADLYKVAAEFGQIENLLGRVLPFRPHYAHATMKTLLKRRFTRSQASQYTEDYIKLLKKFILDYQIGLFNINLYPLFKVMWANVQSNYQFPETRCFNQNHIHIDLRGNIYLCPYRRTGPDFLATLEKESECLANLATIIESRRPRCLSCELYRYCGSYCLASVDADQECYIQKRLISWFVNEMNRNKLDYASLPEQEYAKCTGGYNELSR